MPSTCVDVQQERTETVGDRSDARKYWRALLQANLTGTGDRSRLACMAARAKYLYIALEAGLCKQFVFALTAVMIVRGPRTPQPDVNRPRKVLTL